MAARSGTSILGAAGLNAHVARNAADFVALAVALAYDTATASNRGARCASAS